jgi:hypothetical protein
LPLRSCASSGSSVRAYDSSASFCTSRPRPWCWPFRLVVQSNAKPLQFCLTTRLVGPTRRSCRSRARRCGPGTMFRTCSRPSCWTSSLSANRRAKPALNGRQRCANAGQPDGPSFVVDGHDVRWQKWHFRVGFTPREGPVLHTVSYTDQGRERPIVYRAALADMLVPYGDPRPAYFRRNAFDVGEYGIGMLANSLEHGCDCLGEIHYFDVAGTTAMASRSRYRMPSVCTKRTLACCGSTSTGELATQRRGDRGGW